MKTKVILALVITAALTACSNTVFMECKELPTEGWHKDSLCVFEVPITETDATYQMQLIIRNDGGYPNQNLWLFVDQIKPDKSCTRDTVQFFLADNFGRWTGSGVGSIFENVCMDLSRKRKIQRVRHIQNTRCPRYALRYARRHLRRRRKSD